jgi:hypothetical protein
MTGGENHRGNSQRLSRSGEEASGIEGSRNIPNLQKYSDEEIHQQARIATLPD